MSNDVPLYVVYLNSRMLLSKKRYSSWKETQDEFADYKTSLGPWPVAEVMDFLRMEYPTHCPFAADQIEEFLHSDAETLTT